MDVFLSGTLKGLSSQVHAEATVPGKCTDKWPTGGVYKSESCGLSIIGAGLAFGILGPFGTFQRSAVARWFQRFRRASCVGLDLEAYSDT